MNSNNFLNIHALISHSPSCLNRDDMNMQKSAYFGGVRRVRISSQCLKRAMRQAQHFTDELGPASVRSNKLGKLADQFCEALADRFEPDQVRRAVALIGGKENADEGASADAVAPWCVEEVARVCEIVAAADEEGLDDKKLAKKVKAESQSILKAMAAAADIALFGRMATSGLMTSIDGAMAVAHVITTHSVDADIDWFTAVDDLVVEEGDVGAGHLDTQEFGAGVFYRYASVNLRQLQENLAADSRDKALGVAAHLVRLMATAVPSAKQQSFAAHNPADLVLTSFGKLPLSYANAFEKPVERERNGGFLQPSVAALESYVERVRKGYSLDDCQAVFSLRDTELQPRFESLAAIEDWVRRGGAS